MNLNPRMTSLVIKNMPESYVFNYAGNPAFFYYLGTHLFSSKVSQNMAIERTDHVAGPIRESTDCP